MKSNKRDLPDENSIKLNGPKYTILVDMDNVTCDLHAPWAQWIQENGDPDFNWEKCTTWQTHEFTPLGDKIYDFLAIPKMFLMLDPMPGALDGIKKLRKMGHKIKFCTADPKNSTTAQSEKLNWLIQHVKDFDPETEIIFAHDKSIVPGDIIIDDRVKNCRTFPGVAICFDAPYNARYQGYRAQNWTEVVRIVDRLTKFDLIKK